MRVELDINVVERNIRPIVSPPDRFPLLSTNKISAGARGGALFKLISGKGLNDLQESRAAVLRPVNPDSQPFDTSFVLLRHPR
jgi:hypothetical protein